MIKMKENRLRRFGCNMRKEKPEAVRIVMEMNVEESRERERPKKR